jgi:hypothetical protein
MVLAVLVIGRSLYDMEMNAMQAIYSDGGTFIDAYDFSSFYLAQPDVRSFVQLVPPHLRTERRIVLKLATAMHIHSIYCSNRLTWRLHMIGGGFT